MPANQQMQLSRRLMLSPTGKLMAKKSVIRRPSRSATFATPRRNSFKLILQASASAELLIVSVQSPKSRLLWNDHESS